MLQSSEPRYWIARFVGGVFLILLSWLFLPDLGNAMAVPRMFPLPQLLLGAYGFWLALAATGPLARVAAQTARERTEQRAAASEAFARASLPRRVFYLLTAIADADRPPSEAEQRRVREFLLERFVDAVDAHEVELWQSQPLPDIDRRGLAARIRTGLDPAEVDTLFVWCCLVAFADDGFAAPEHAALQEVARGLGLPGSRARMLFHLARAQHQRGDTGPRFGSDADEPEAPPVDARSAALATLGLPADATPELIRKRHRELVRKFHPDAQPNLGAYAQQEAQERFVQIQRAYETLTH